MDKNDTTFESIWEKVEQLSETTLELSKLKALETVTNVISAMTVKISVIMALIFFVFIVNMGVALQIGTYLGEMSYGFYVVAAFYLLAALVLHFYLHRWIKNSITELIIEKTLQQKK